MKRIDVNNGRVFRQSDVAPLNPVRRISDRANDRECGSIDINRILFPEFVFMGSGNKSEMFYILIQILEEKFKMSIRRS